MYRDTVFSKAQARAVNAQNAVLRVFSRHLRASGAGEVLVRHGIARLCHSTSGNARYLGNERGLIWRTMLKQHYEDMVTAG